MLRGCLGCVGCSCVADTAQVELKSPWLEAYRHRISVLCPGVDTTAVISEAQAVDVLERNSTDEVGFLQTFNLHRAPGGGAGAGAGAGAPAAAADEPAAAKFIMSSRLAHVAAQLLGVDADDERLRIYQSCVFVKPPGRAVQVDPIKPTVKAPGIKLLKLQYGKPLSNVTFKFSLRRYTPGSARRTGTATPTWCPWTPTAS